MATVYNEGWVRMLRWLQVYKIIQESAEAESGSDDEPTSITPVLMPAMAERR